MESINIEIKLQQHQDETESLTRNRPCSSLSTSDSSFFFNGCNSNCTDYDYEHSEVIRLQSEKKKRMRRSPAPKLSFTLFPDIKNTKSLETNKASKKTVTKSKNEPLKDYCPYSSDNCGCSSGCTDCDYGLYTYTTKNKSKLKNKDKKLYVRSSNGFRPLTVSERSQNAKSFIVMNILRKKKAKPSKIGKALESCYPESSGSYNRKSSYIKRDFKLQITGYRKPKSKKKTSAKNLRKLKIRTRTLKLHKNKKVLKNAVKISEKDVRKNWFLHSSNDNECNSNHMDYGKCRTIKRKNRRVRIKPKISKSSVINESVKNEGDSKQTAKVYSKSTSRDRLEFVIDDIATYI